MGLASRLVPVRTRAGEPTRDWWFNQEPPYASSSAGKTVTAETAAGLPAVWAAVSLLADQVGGLPLKVYTRRTDGGALMERPTSSQSRLLAQPNAECTPFDLWQQIVYSLELWGNAYIGKEKAGGRLVALWPIHPKFVTVRRINGRKVFQVQEYDSGALRVFTQDDVIHIKGRSLDGFVGVSPINLHRQTLGLGMALDEFGGTTLGNRAVPLGVLSVKGRITDPAARDNLRREWADRFKGSKRGNNIAILDDGATFDAVSMPLSDAQYIEQRKINGADIARIYGIAPEMIGYESGGSLTYSTVEAQAIGFVRYSLRPRLVRIEQALFADRDLFSNIGGLLPRFDTNELLRGDTWNQYRALSLAVAGKPFMAIAEARDRIGLDPSDGSPELDPMLQAGTPPALTDTTA